jgi:hypothetical protein
MAREVLGLAGPLQVLKTEFSAFFKFPNHFLPSSHLSFMYQPQKSLSGIPLPFPYSLPHKFVIPHLMMCLHPFYLNDLSTSSYIMHFNFIMYFGLSVFLQFQ